MREMLRAAEADTGGNPLMVADLWSNLGCCLEALGKDAEALEYGTKALRRREKK